MPVTLNEAKSNAVEDLDVAAIDEFRKESAVLDELATQRSAAFRAYNTEYTPEHVTTTKVSVTLALLGGSFEVDRVLEDRPRRQRFCRPAPPGRRDQR